MCHDVVSGRLKSEKNEATPSRARVIGGGGEGVCAVTDEVLCPGEHDGAADGDVEGRSVFFLPESFFVVVV